MKVTVLYPQLKNTMNRPKLKKRLDTPYQNVSTGPKSVPAKGADTIQLSSTAARVQQVRGEFTSDPAIRQEKVAELRRQIEDGTYKADSEIIAAKILEESFLFKP